MRSFWKWFIEKDFYIPLGSGKAGRFEKMFSFGNSHSIVTRGSRLSRAPHHHTLPAFLNLYERKITIKDNLGSWWHATDQFCKRNFEFFFLQIRNNIKIFWRNRFKISKAASLCSRVVRPSLNRRLYWSWPNLILKHFSAKYFLIGLKVWKE